MMHLYSAGRARPLAARLAEVLGDRPSDPMTPEWLAVPSDGMRRWLTLALAGHLGASGPDATDGVAANIQRAYPGTLRSCVLAADRDDPAPGSDPWGIERLVWSVLAVADGHADDPVLEAIVAVPAGASRYARARRVADHFDRYHQHRPDMIRAWSAGNYVDGIGKRIADHAIWQPHLWRLVREQIGEPSPPECLPGLLDRLRSGDLHLDLPDRLLLFGFTLLPGHGFLELAEAVAVHREVHLFLLEPFHFDVGQLHRLSPPPGNAKPRLRSADPTAGLVHQPLLRSWGRLHRETAILLADAEANGFPVPQWVDVPEETVSPATVLARLQRDIRTNAGPGTPLVGDPTDRSVQFHACFGPTRQVEVLRDAILHLLNEPGSNLSEDDILVVCPTLDRFAPLIDAAFGPPAAPSTESPRPDATAGRAGAPALRYRIVAQSIRTTNPVLSATMALLELVAGRFEVSPVLEFLALGPVRERFGFDDDALATVTRWVTETNVRWGIDPVHRVPFGVPESVTTNTWQAGLDRLLVGSAVHDEVLALAVGDVVPCGIEGSDVELAGCLAEALWHLGNLAAESSRARPFAEWVRTLREASAALFTTDRDTEWQIEALQRVLDEVVQASTVDGAPSTVPLEFIDLRRLLGERLDAMPGRPDFFRGGITISSMTPLRWIPFRVVCLLGMDQSAFGAVTAAGDDLASVAPQVGDRDPRAESRQALLEAVLVAEDRLVVVRDGHDVRTNQEVPRAVVAAELFDSVTAVVGPCRPEFPRPLEIDHPRQAFDDPCFEVGRLVPGTAWGFEQGNVAGALARRARDVEAPPFLAGPLAAVDSDVIELAELRAFFTKPTEYFLTHRLGAHLPTSADDPSPLLPVELDPLERWNVGMRLLDARLAGADLEAWREAERGRGTLPPGWLEADVVEKLDGITGELVEAARRLGARGGPADPHEVEVVLPDGTRVVGSVALRLQAPGPGPARISLSRIKPEHRLAAWIDLMALVGTDPSTAWRSLVLGRSEGRRHRAVAMSLVPSAAPGLRRESARGGLAVAVDCYRRGLSEPIPLFPDSSYEVYGGNPKGARWSPYRSTGEGDGAAVVLAFGRLRFDEIMALPARPGDPPGPGGRVERFANYLYGAVDSSADEWDPLGDAS